MTLASWDSALICSFSKSFPTFNPYSLQVLVSRSRAERIIEDNRRTKNRNEEEEFNFRTARTSLGQMTKLKDLSPKQKRKKQ
ncbi:hypothetical protein RB195_003493 [Necator americanus]|uniref:Uncharacterized protein n=1 Tax=Necator americanus TaxID=51031 RepID=A0ABR1DNU8_NECAM